jgi:hypothetical protein
MRANAAIWVALAAIVVVVVAPFVVFVLRDLAHAPDAEAAAGVLYKWQGLFTGLLALVGAVVAALVVIRQIETARQIEEDRREARGRALWIRLTQELSNFESYLDRCAAVLIRAHVFFLTQRDGNLSGAFEAEQEPNLPTTRYVIENVAGLLEFCRASEVEPLAEFVVCLQIQRSRMVDLISVANGETANNIDVYGFLQSAVDLGEIQFYRDALLVHARSTRRRPPKRITADRVFKAINHLFWNYGNCDDILGDVRPIIKQRSTSIYGNLRSRFDGADM